MEELKVDCVGALEGLADWFGYVSLSLSLSLSLSAFTTLAPASTARVPCCGHHRVTLRTVVVFS
eukprot:COSAG05_NODE_9380_length_628_cov_0.744802_1_plen_64_part_10